MTNYKQAYGNKLAQLEGAGSIKWEMSVGAGEVLHIPAESVFSFGGFQQFAMLNKEQVKDKENKVVQGKWRFDSVNRNILHFSKYPPRLDYYGVLNHSVVFGGQEGSVDFQETSLQTTSIPLSKLGRDGDWLSHDMTIEAAPPMGVLPVGTIIKFGKGLVKNHDLQNNWDFEYENQGGSSIPQEGLEPSKKAIIELFREKYKTNAFGQHLVKGKGEWIITANAGVNARGLIRNKAGKIKRFYSHPYTLRRVKIVGPSASDMRDESPKVGYGELELYKENDANRIELRADVLHELLWLTVRHLNDAIQEGYAEILEANKEDIEEGLVDMSYENYCKDMDWLYDRETARASDVAVSIYPAIWHPFHLERIMDKNDGRWGHGLGLHTRKTFVDTGGWKGSGPSYKPAGMAQPNYWVNHPNAPPDLNPIYLSIPITTDVSGSIEPYCLDKTSSILSPFDGSAVKESIEKCEEITGEPFASLSKAERYESLRIPIIWYIQRWLWNKPSYGGPVWANYQGSLEYKMTVLNDESWALEGMDTTTDAGASSNPRFQFATKTYNLVGKQYQ